MDRSFKIFILLSLVSLILTILVLYRKYHIDNIKDEYTITTKQPLKYIPKKIFQTISDKDTLSPKFQKNIDYIKNLNPGWEYKLFDDKDRRHYILKYYGEEYLKCYDMINPKYGPCRADFFRYLLMYQEGGVYLDIKSAMERPLDTIIHPEDEYILSYWICPCNFSVLKNDITEGEYQQWHIICRPKHPFLKEVIKLVIENIKTYRISDGVGKYGVLKLSGPIVYTEAIMPIIDKYNHRLVETEEYLGLVYNNLKNLENSFNTFNTHKNLFSKTHYSKLNEPIILK
jgi:mannosyltransferase OCH1-like enzyme